ncbi:interferon-inducible GTPase 5-like [Terrapene carolina triunguis]|uniref:interferon-inducible GTPase 5-like n=1 Tax=Terrapene triunguis TaxID=2587831 RepID=UPI000E77654D|nr:interferon-inducible GTPase 5-like [Terrapene carolina triunguis]
MAGVDAKELPKIPEEDIEALKAAFGEGNLTEASVKVKEALETADKITLNIAVTGESGSGKSSFVNAIRGLKDRDKGATAIGVTETTMKLLDYSHPSYPNVTVWDLPGIGTPTFKPHTYLKEVEFSRYDFFIIISCTRFISHDIQLAQEIQKLGKKFYFVRSKVDQDLANEKKMYDEEGILEQSNAPTNRPPPYSESAILDVIREDCIKGLKTGGVASPRIFLVTRWDLGKFDFPKLQETLVNELPSHKKLILLRSLSHVSKETLEKKKEQLQTQIWLKSLVSCGIAAVPIPGLSTVCDVAMLVTSLKGFCRDFGLDEKSLSALSKRTKIPIAELKAVIKSPLSEEITKDLVITLLTKCGTGAVQYSTILLKFIPVVGAVVGSVAAAAVALPTTKIMLQNFLDDVAADALRVLEVVMKGAISNSEMPHKKHPHPLKGRNVNMWLKGSK